RAFAVYLLKPLRLRPQVGGARIDLRGQAPVAGLVAVYPVAVQPVQQQQQYRQHRAAAHVAPLPPQRPYLERPACRLGAPRAARMRGLDLQGVTPRRQADELHVAARATFDPGIVQATQPGAIADAFRQQVAETGIADRQPRPARQRTSATPVQGLSVERDRFDHRWRRRPVAVAPEACGIDPGHPACGGDPDAAVAPAQGRRRGTAVALRTGHAIDLGVLRYRQPAVAPAVG